MIIIIRHIMVFRITQYIIYSTFGFTKIKKKMLSPVMTTLRLWVLTVCNDILRYVFSSYKLILALKYLISGI